jgi:CheY-like chemotaxis protein
MLTASLPGAVVSGVVYARTPTAESAGQNARVLVCDDETRLGDLTAGLLQECGFRAGFVPNAVLAMQYLDQHQDTSVLLLDVNLSGSQSTFELLTELAQRPKRPRVVLTSGSARQDIRAELTHHPLVVGYLEKPYAEEELTSTISDAVS